MAQNFVDRVGPAVSAAWLNQLDAELLTQYNLATATGTANAIALAVTNIGTPALFTRVVFKAIADNTGATTLAVNGGSATPVVTQDGAALTAGTLRNGGIYTAFYTGTSWMLTQSTGALPLVVAQRTTDLALSTGAFSAITFTELIDTDNFFDGTTFTPTIAGYYRIQAAAYFYSTGTLTYSTLGIGNTSNVEIVRLAQIAGITSTQTAAISCDTVMYLDGATGIRILALSVGTSLSLNAGAVQTYPRFSAQLVRRA